MPRYPKDKAAKLALYDAIKAGISANPGDFPSGPGQPFALADLNNAIAALGTSIPDRQQKEGVFRLAVTVENEDFDDGDAASRKLLDVAVAIHGVNSPKLSLIGWAPIDAPTSIVPGPARTLEAVVQGPGTCFLDWKSPAPGGGAVSYFKVMARKRDLQGQQLQDWTLIATATDSEAMLSGLDRGVEYDFQVIATNPTGDSIPSNTVSVVL